MTEYDLAPRSQILQSCSELGVKQGQTLGERFVALLLGEGLQSPFFMPDGLIHPTAWKMNSPNLNFVITEFYEVRMEDHA